MQHKLERVWKVLRNPSYLTWKIKTSARHTIKSYYGALLARVRANKERACVVMIHIGRSGSTLMGDLLDQHPDVFWDGEVWRKLADTGSSGGSEHVIGSRELCEFISNRKALARGAYMGSR